MRFSRQEYWSGLPFPSPGDLPRPGIQHQVSHIAGRFLTVWATRETLGDGPQGTSEIIYLGKNLLDKVVLVILRILLWGAKDLMTVFAGISLSKKPR